MPQSLAKVALHLIFSTKNRTPWLKKPDIRAELYAYMSSVLRAVDSPALLIGGVEDHVHILCLLSRNYAISKVVEEVKKQSSKWLKSKGAELDNFYWQGGYGVFSVSESKIPGVRQYIQRQEEHHKRFSFQEEYRQICAKHGVQIDERYVWD